MCGIAGIYNFDQSKINPEISNLIKDSLPKIKAWIEVDDGTPSQVPESLNYTQLLKDCEPMDRWQRPEDKKER